MSRNKILTVFMVLGFSFPTFTSFAAKGDAISLPDLRSDEQKLAYLLAIKKQVPKLFKDAATYDIDPFHILDDQTKLVTTLKNNPKCQELFENKHYYQLTITPPAGGLSVGSIQIKPEAVQAWKDELQKTFDEFNTNH